MKLISLAGVVPKRRDRAWVQWNLAGLAVLASADHEQTGAQVEVAPVEGDRLPDPQPTHGEQPDQRLVGRGAQWRGDRSRRPHQPLDLGFGIQVRDSPPRRQSGQQIGGRHLRAGVESLHVPGEAPHHGQPLAPVLGHRRRWLHRPRERQLAGDAGCLRFLGVAHE